MRAPQTSGCAALLSGGAGLRPASLDRENRVASDAVSLAMLLGPMRARLQFIMLPPAYSTTSVYDHHIPSLPCGPTESAACIARYKKAKERLPPFRHTLLCNSAMACPVNHPWFHAVVFLLGVIVVLSRYVRADEAHLLASMAPSGAANSVLGDAAWIASRRAMVHA